MQFIKGRSSHQIHKARNQKMEIWQVGFHDWTIRDWNDWQTKVKYIHSNPVEAKLVQRAEDWPYSSASGKFSLDPIPEKFLQLSSGAKAQTASELTQGLKPLPPKETATTKACQLNPRLPAHEPHPHSPGSCRHRIAAGEVVERPAFGRQGTARKRLSTPAQKRFASKSKPAANA